MDKNQKNLLIELMNHETLSGKDLASRIQMSTRSVRTIIKNINENIIGARIESGSFGYRLTIETPETFLAYLQRDQNGKEESRLAYLFNRFIDNQNYLKIDDLSKLKPIKIENISNMFSGCWNVHINSSEFWSNYFEKTPIMQNTFSDSAGKTLSSNPPSWYN